MPIPENLLDRARKPISGNRYQLCRLCRPVRPGETGRHRLHHVCDGQEDHLAAIRDGRQRLCRETAFCGLKKGDIVATILTLTEEHIYLMYACYRIGLIIAPLDVRLKGSRDPIFHGQDESQSRFLPGQDTRRRFSSHGRRRDEKYAVGKDLGANPGGCGRHSGRGHRYPGIYRRY